MQSHHDLCQALTEDGVSETDSERKMWKNQFNSVQTRCIVEGEAQKNPLFWRRAKLKVTDLR